MFLQSKLGQKRKSCEKSVCFIKPKFKIIRSVLAFSLLFGVVFIPLNPVEAGFLSTFFGDPALADNVVNTNTVQPPQAGDNSQNISLSLQPNVSPATVLEDKNKGSDTDNIDPNSNINIVENNSLMPSTGPSGVSDGTDIPDYSSGGNTSVYVVRKGDSLSQIADIFGVSVDTILLANDMKKGDTIKEGQILVILPVSGLEHIVTTGETVSSIAKHFNVDPTDIATYNGISLNDKLTTGDQLLIPGAEVSVESD
ncbi:MAG: LysM peptidoglycan-binding domain-containing protein, partial [Minisyncoccia bacterium]